MAGVSTGISLLSTLNSLLRDKMAVWIDFASGSTYNNEVNSIAALTGVSGLQSSSSPVAAGLGSYHNDLFSTSGIVHHTLSNSCFNKTAFSAGNTYTIGFWLKTDTLSHTVDCLAMLVGNTANPAGTTYSSNTQGIINHSGSIYFNDFGTAKGGVVIPNTSWNFYCFTFTGSQVLTYKNSVLTTTSSFTSSFITSAIDVDLVSKYYKSTTAGSRVVQVDSLFMSSILSQDDINYLYNSGSGRIFSNLPNV